VGRCSALRGTSPSLESATVSICSAPERAVEDGEQVYWRFVEHRDADPLLPPGPGWMQGAAGIAAYLFRLARLLEVGPEAESVRRMDTWWALPG
jgi:hypothetical protein